MTSTLQRARPRPPVVPSDCPRGTRGGAATRSSDVPAPRPPSLTHSRAGPDLTAPGGKTPVFLDATDADRAWAKAAGPEGGRAAIEVHDLVEMVNAANAGAPGDFDKIVLYPLPDSIKYVRKARRRGNGNARLHAAIGG